MYFLRRLLLLGPLLLMISFVAFLLVHATPGSPFDRERGPASQEIERAIKARVHLDEPILKQYLRYIGLVWERDANGHWRHAQPTYDLSMRYRNHSVKDVIAQGLPVSMSLGLLAFGFALGVGLPLGYFSGDRRGHWQDYAGSFFAILVICVPGLVVGPLLVILFALKWR